jgi:hypothetical protein
VEGRWLCLGHATDLDRRAQVLIEEARKEER